MKKFLGIYLDADAKTFDAAWRSQEQDIIAIMKDDPFGAKGVPPSELHKIDNADVQQSLIDRAAARRGAAVRIQLQFMSRRAGERQTLVFSS